MDARSFARHTDSTAAGKHSPGMAEEGSPGTAEQDSGEGSLSIAGLLEFGEVSSAAPEVLAGEDELSRTIRWVHIADSEHVERFLEGGELVLTTATTFRRSAAAMSEFFDQLERAGAAGTIVELVDEDSAPDEQAAAIVRAAAAGRSLPIVLLPHRVKFVRITELAHRRLLAQQLSRLEHRSEEHTSELQSRGQLVCRLLLA